MKHKSFVSLLLVFTLFFSSTCVTFANTVNDEISNSECKTVCNLENEITDYSVNYLKIGNNFMVVVKDKEGTCLASAITDGSTIVVTDYTDTANPQTITISGDELYSTECSINSDAITQNTKGITWSDWSKYEKVFKTHKLTAAVILSVFSAWLLSKGVVWEVPALINAIAILVAGGYDYARLLLKVRTGIDSNYSYAQEQLTIRGRHTENGANYKIYGPKTCTRKKSLNNS